MTPNQIPPRNNPSLRWVLGAAIGVFAADQMLKTLAFSMGGNDTWLFPILNHGTGWGFFYLPTLQLVVVVSAVAVGAGALGWWLVNRRMISPVVLGIVLGGILGNVYDRVTLGAVRDFLDIPQVGIVNLADIAIAIGCVAWIMGVVRSHLRGRHNQNQLPQTRPVSTAPKV